MPTLRFHGIDKDQISEFLVELYNRLTDIYQLTDDQFTLEVDNSDWLDRNGDAEGFPMVEILAFRREPEVEDRVAKAIFEVLKMADYPDSEVYFIHLEPRHYYSNGVPFEQ